MSSRTLALCLGVGVVVVSCVVILTMIADSSGGGDPTHATAGDASEASGSPGQQNPTPRSAATGSEEPAAHAEEDPDNAHRERAGMTADAIGEVREAMAELDRLLKEGPFEEREQFVMEWILRLRGDPALVAATAEYARQVDDQMRNNLLILLGRCGTPGAVDEIVEAYRFFRAQLSPDDADILENRLGRTTDPEEYRQIMWIIGTCRAELPPNNR